VRARALVNTAYVVAAAQPAPRYCGHSLVVDPLGDVIAEAGEGEEVVTARLERSVLDRAREINPSLLNRRM
jgi:predicted amidohydrolase